MLNGEKRAVKIPLANCSDPDGAVADLTNEIRILKRLSHPHLCSVYGAGGWRTEGELPFLVLERLQYKNLAQQVKMQRVQADLLFAFQPLYCIVVYLCFSLMCVHVAGSGCQGCLGVGKITTTFPRFSCRHFPS